MPDLDVANPDVTAELDGIARFWVDEMGAAGFRLDAARHLLEDGSTLENTPATFDWLAGFRSRLQSPTPDALVLGEVWDSTTIASRYVRDGALDLTFDFDLAAQMLLAVKSGDSASLRATQAAVSEAYPAGGYAAFLTNHDQDRTFDVVGRDVAAAKQVATLLITNPGIPFLYHGEEVGLRGRKPDERIRTPMPWTGEAPGHGFTTADAPWEPFADGVAEGTSVAAQTDDPASLLAHYRELIAARGALPALRPGGSWTPMEAPYPAVYAVLRHDPATGDAAVVVSNLSDEPLADVKLELADGPLCGSPTPRVIVGDAPTGLAAPVISPGGGVGEWPIGALGPHQDLVIALEP
jgi:glycosidase